MFMRLGDGAVLALIAGWIGYGLRLRHEARLLSRKCARCRLSWLVTDLPEDTDERLGAP